MAVTRIFQSGFELQNYGYDGWSINGHDANYYGYETSSPTPNTGNACMTLHQNGFSNGSLATPMNGTAQARVNLWIFVPTGATFNDQGLLIGGFWNVPTELDQTSNVLSVQMNGNTFHVFPGNNDLSAWEDSFTMINDVWVPIGIDMYCHDSSGYVRIWYNGVMVMDISGDTFDSEDEINMFTISPFWNSAYIESVNGDMYVDDVSIWDTSGESVSATPPEMKKYHWVTPDGNGNYDDWVGSDANSVDNYLHVDDIPPDDDTSYIESSTPAERDSYTMTSVDVGGETIDAVIPVIVAKIGGGVDTLQPFIREDGTDDDGSAVNVGTAYATMEHERFTTEPGGGAWDEAQVNAMEIGVLVP